MKELKFMVVLLLTVLSVTTNEDGDDSSGSTSPSLVSGFGPDEMSLNATLSCIEESLNESAGAVWGDYETAAVTVTSIRIVYLSLLFLSGVTLNSFLVYLVAKHKQLHTLSFAIALQVAVVNLILSLCLFPTSILSLAVGRWPFGKFACALTGFINNYFIYLRVILMPVLMTDRFMSVFFPVFYPKHKVKIAVSLSVLLWVLAAIIHVIILPGVLECYSFVPALACCNHNPSCNRNCYIFYLVITATTSLPSVLLPLSLFCALYCKGRKLRHEIPSDNACRREQRATVTFFLLFLSVFVVMAPTIIATVITFLDSAEMSSAVSVVFTVGGLLFHFLVVTDPIVILHNRDVRDILSKAKLLKVCLHDTSQ